MNDMKFKTIDETVSLNKVIDLYTAKIGDTLLIPQFDATESHLYAEGIRQNKYLVINLNPIYNLWTVSIVESPKNSEVARQVIVGDLGGNDVLNFAHVKPSSLIQALYRVMRETNKSFKLTLVENAVIIERKILDIDYTKILADAVRDGLSSFELDMSKIENMQSLKTKLYRVARSFNVSITISGKVVVVNGARKFRTSVNDELSSWLYGLAYDNPTAPPKAITDVCDDAYIRVILNKQSYFATSYRNGMITKHSYRLCNRAGGVELRTTGKVLTRIENVKLSGINDNHRSVMNTQLHQHGIRLNDKNEVEPV